MRRLLRLLRCGLAQIRVIVLMPLVLAYLAAFDLVLRIVHAWGSDALFQSGVVRVTRGVVWLLEVCWGLKLKLDPALSRLLDQPGCTILTANHQSPLDILLLLHILCVRPTHFVCRPGLERGIPTISRIIRHQCAVLRDNPRENSALLKQLGQQIEGNQGTAVIFPEGRKTAKTYAELLRFKRDGLARLVAAAPSARVVCVAIRGAHNAWPSPWALPRPGAVVEVLVAHSWYAPDVAAREAAHESERAIRHALGLPYLQDKQGETAWT
ncbi:MAG: 1-acyl-sn-glycerol-3-phosphate acyltransferase [Ramlibacter sp.]|jgi:1-acyl-sn-glycerol-3-phosphate acyltransferase